MLKFNMEIQKFPTNLPNMSFNYLLPIKDRYIYIRSNEKEQWKRYILRSLRYPREKWNYKLSFKIIFSLASYQYH